jgi:hypothetical protein
MLSNRRAGGAAKETRVVSAHPDRSRSLPMGTYYSRSARAIRSVDEFGREVSDPGARELAPGLVKG